MKVVGNGLNAGARNGNSAGKGRKVALEGNVPIAWCVAHAGTARHIPGPIAAGADSAAGDVPAGSAQHAYIGGRLEAGILFIVTVSSSVCGRSPKVTWIE